jgi:hypothetical protein
LTANYFTQTYINSTFATIASLSSYVTNSSLATTLAGYVTNSSLATTLADYVTNSSLATTLADYVTNSNLATTLADYVTNSSLATTLSSYATIAYVTAQNFVKVSDIASYTTNIATNTSGTKSRVNCASNTEILFSIQDVQKLRMFVPAGQSTQPCGLIADDKIQMISKENSFSLTGQKALAAKPI